MGAKSLRRGPKLRFRLLQGAHKETGHKETESACGTLGNQHGRSSRGASAHPRTNPQDLMVSPRICKCMLRHLPNNMRQQLY